MGAICYGRRFRHNTAKMVVMTSLFNSNCRDLTVDVFKLIKKRSANQKKVKRFWLEPGKENRSFVNNEKTTRRPINVVNISWTSSLSSAYRCIMCVNVYVCYCLRRLDNHAGEEQLYFCAVGSLLLNYSDCMKKVAYVKKITKHECWWVGANWSEKWERKQIRSLGSRFRTEHKHS